MENILSSKLIAVLNSLTHEDAIEALHPDSDHDSRREHEARLALRDQLLKALGIHQDHPYVREWNTMENEASDRYDHEEAKGKLIREDGERYADLVDARDDAFEVDFEF